MGLAPKMPEKKQPFQLKKCSCCGASFGPESFAPTTSFIYADGVIPICDDCAERLLSENGYEWEFVDKFCQMVDVPFVPTEFENVRKLNPSNTFHTYAEIMRDGQYEGIDWATYHKRYLDLVKAGRLDTELPGLSEEFRNTQRKKWGANYDDAALDYLDGLYNGLISTQNVNGALQGDQALKICKISYEIDQRIAEGSDFDKLLSSYDKLVKTAEFTPKNVKNLNDFDSCGELIK